MIDIFQCIAKGTQILDKTQQELEELKRKYEEGELIFKHNQLDEYSFRTVYRFENISIEKLKEYYSIIYEKIINLKALLHIIAFEVRNRKI